MTNEDFTYQMYENERKRLTEKVLTGQRRVNLNFTEFMISYFWQNTIFVVVHFQIIITFALNSVRP